MKRNGKSIHLPMELTTNIILNRIPIKSMLRFRSVSKAWCSLIDHTTFPHNMHFKIASQITDPSSFIIIPLYYKDHLYMVPNTSTFQSSNINIPFTSSSGSSEHNPSLFLIGSCNGLLCLSCWGDLSTREPTCSIYICNPATREYLTLPNFTFSNASGFGFDSLSKQFKLVQMVNWLDEGEMKSEAKVYRFGSKSWRTMKGEGVPLLGSNRGRGPHGVFFNGSLYFYTQGFDVSIRIAAFDLANETFRLLPNPEFSLITDSVDAEIGVLGDCLCLTDCTLDDRCEIWTMKGHSWTKQIVISKHLTNGVDIEYSVYPVCLRSNGELMLLCDFKFLVSYNLESGKSTQLENIGLPELGLRPIYKAFPFIGSLISPKSACGIGRTVVE